MYCHRRGNLCDVGVPGNGMSEKIMMCVRKEKFYGENEKNLILLALSSDDSGSRHGL